MPYYMLEDAINVSKKALEEHDFEEQGVDVSSKYAAVILTVDCANSKEIYG